MLQRMRNSYCCKNRIEKSGYGPVKITTVNHVYMEKEVLVIYGQKRRNVRFEGSDDLDAQRSRVYDAVRRVFDDVLTTVEGSSKSCSQNFILQIENQLWGVMIDFTMITEEQGDAAPQNSAVSPQIMYRQYDTYSLSGYHSNSLILWCFIHLQYHLGLKLCSKWMVEDHSLDQLLFKSIGSTLF